MPQLTSFVTAKFDPAEETPNEFNPIAGEAVLNWLREQLLTKGYEVTTPQAEDWGWYIHAALGPSSYLVGASGESDETTPNVEWTIQLRKERSLKEKLFGQNKITVDDSLSLFIQRLVDQETGFRNVVHWSE